MIEILAAALFHRYQETINKNGRWETIDKVARDKWRGYAKNMYIEAGYTNISVIDNDIIQIWLTGTP